MHYVISDLHGDYDAYLGMLEQIHFTKNDVLYILGDVIDRGKDPIALLKQIKNQDNVIFLIGNHEDMMLKALKKIGSNLEELSTSVEMKRWGRNGGMATLEQFIQLDESDQKELIHFLENAWLVIPQLLVGEKCYYLVHACPGENYYLEPMKYGDATNEEIHQMLWDRRCLEEWSLPETFDNYNEATILLFGHSKTSKFMKEVPSKIKYFSQQNAYDIDCHGQLGCICLETLDNYYIVPY